MKKVISILTILSIILLAGCIKDKMDNKYEIAYKNIDEVFKKAIETKNETICDKALGFSDRCYNQLARITKNPNLCKSIHKDEPTKGTCHHAPVDIAYCAIYIEYSGYEEDYGACVAEASDYNINLCAQLNDKNQKKLCLTTVYLKKNDLTDPKACLLQADEGVRELCRSMIIGNICNINQTACSAQQCLDLDFSVDLGLDLCKQTTAMAKCKNEKELCSTELCNKLNLSSVEALERCRGAISRILTNR